MMIIKRLALAVLTLAVLGLAVSSTADASAHGAPHASPPVILNEIQAYQNVVATGDVLFLFRYDLPLFEVGGGAAWCDELTDTDGCSATPPAPVAPASLAAGLAELRYYTDAARTDLRLSGNVPRVGNALGGLYAGTGHGLTFNSGTARACVESSPTFFTAQATACSPIMWRDGADLAATNAILGPDMVQMMLNLQTARELPWGDLVTGTGLITNQNTRRAGVEIADTAGQIFALAAFGIADRIIPEVFQTSGGTILGTYTVPTGNTALQTSLDAQSSGGTVELALSAVGQEWFGITGPQMVIFLVLLSSVFLAAFVSFATKGDAAFTIIAAWLPIVMGSWFRGPTIAVIFTALSVFAMLAVLWFSRKVPTG